MSSENKIAQSLPIATLLTFCGGFIDTYTYLMRGHTLSAGQTGNVIFFSASLVQGNIPGMVNRGLTILSFIIGLLIVVLVQSKTHSIYWRIFEMLPLILITFFVGFLERSFPNYLVVPAIALGMSMQSGAFRKVNGMGYSNVFTSGNLRKSVLSWGEYEIIKDKNQIGAAKDYLLIVLSFILGAVSSALLQKIFGVRTIWFATMIITAVNIAYYCLVRKDIKKSKI